MADRDLRTILDDVEAQEKTNPASALAPLPPPSLTIPPTTPLAFAPQRHRDNVNARTTSDSFEQVQLDFRKHIQDMETRLKTLLDEFKRALG